MAIAPVSPAPSLARWTLQPLPVASSENYAGQLFAGRYLMRDRIGRGGMSTIYEAHDTTLGVSVAVKIMRGDLPIDPVDRFRREAHVLATIKHEHIARIIDRHDPETGPRFLVTEYINGIDLGELRGRGPVPAAVVHHIGTQVSAALAYVHDVGLIHRDIKPSNLMLERHPSGDIFAKLIDFGIVQLRGSTLAAPEHAPPGARRATRGDVLGTAPYYCGHEGYRRDVHALALTLAELLTGQAPDAIDLASTDTPLARVLTKALHADDMTMEGLHTALSEAEEQPADEAEAERRRYAAALFDRAASAPGPAPAPDEPPRFAGRYILCGELGQGGMGRVQIVFDTKARRRVALKTIHPRNAGMQNLEFRFRREARALAAIERGAPTLYDCGEEPEHYFTMEIVEGVTLAATLTKGKIEPERALSLATDLAEILHGAHGVGVVHRDVKPDNIIIGHGDHVRLLDFGACLLMPGFHRRHLVFPATPAGERFATGALEAVGTPGYTAPEVLNMDGGAGPRSDIYSVCAVLYEMLTGRPLFDRATTRTHPIERGEFPAVLGPVADLLRRGTEREPADRVATMSDLLRCLLILRAGLVGARQRRQKAGIAAIAVAGTMIAGLAVLAVVPTPAATKEIPAVAQPEPTAPAATTPPPTRPPEPASPTSTSPPKTVDLDQAQPAVNPPSAPPRPAVALTERVVATRLAMRAAKIRAECGVPWIVLDLAIERGQATLASINGLAFTEADPVHACVRTQLRGLRFPRAEKRVEFSLPIDLSTKEPR